MDWADLAIDVGKGWLRLTCSVAAGIVLGVLLEASGWLKKMSAAWSPATKYYHLPAVCGSSFLLAFASPSSANSLLASWFRDGRISRRSMLLGGITHAFPASSHHIRTIALILIPLLGIAGIAYVLFLLTLNTLCTLSILLVSRLWKEKNSCSMTDGWLETADIDHQHKPSFLEFCQLTKKRFLSIYLRVMTVSFPLYALFLFLTRKGVFAHLNQLLPPSLPFHISAESLSIITSHLGGILNAAAIAGPFLRNGVLSNFQVFITLVIGYVVSLPLRTIRHALPSALGIFPGKNGIYITAYIQGLKIILALITIIAALPMGKYS